VPFAISPAVRSSIRRTASATVKRLTRPLFEFRVPPEFSTPVPSRSAAAGRHLSWAFGPFSTCKARRSTVRGRRHAPATVRPQGLVTLSAVYALRARAGLVSSRQRSWDSPCGAFSSRKVPAAFPPGCTHLPFLPSVIPPHEAEGRPNEPRLLGFDPSGSPWRRAVISAPNRWLLPWALPS